MFIIKNAVVYLHKRLFEKMLWKDLHDFMFLYVSQGFHLQVILSLHIKINDHKIGTSKFPNLDLWTSKTLLIAK